VNYTVTATNASGSTTATVSLVVNSAAPSISYSSTLITLTTGVPAQGVTPSNSGGAVVAWSISPATLPAGLTFNTTTGSIGGTPTVATAPAAYVVTAENSGGKSTASVTLGVQTVLLDLVHSGPIASLLLSPSRVLSVGLELAINQRLFEWVLWNYTTAGKLARGNLGCWSSTCTSAMYPYVDLEGLTMVDETGAGLEVRSSADGSVLSVLSTLVAWWKLASDGSYVCAGSATALTVWSPTGTVIATRAGDYSTAVVFAAPSQVQVALGPAGTNVVETVALPQGTSSMGPPFQGQFNSWFLDGQQFLTNVGDTVWVYTKDTHQKDLTTLPSVGNLTGTGNWFWTYPSHGQTGPLNIYQVGNSSSPTASYPLTSTTAVVPSGTTIGLLSDSGSVSIIDLSGSTPASTNYVSPLGPAGAYGFLSASQWMLGTGSLYVGSGGGVLIDGVSLAGTPRYFDYGAPWAVAASASRVAVGTAAGQILYLDASTGALEGKINLAGPSDNNPGKLAMSSDGTVLAAFPSKPNNTLTIYSLPSGTLLNSFTYATSCAATLETCLWDFTLSASGTMLGQVIGTWDGTSWTCSRQVTALIGGPVLWSDTVADTGSAFNDPGGPCSGVPIRLTADGTEVAVSNYKFNRPNQGTTNIYKNGTLVTAVPGWTVGWLDADRILVNNYGTLAGDPAVNYLGASIYNSSGMKLADLAYPNLLPEFNSFDVVSADSVYDPSSNAIYSLTNGMATWTSASPLLPTYEYTLGAIAGPNVVFASGHEIVSQPH
jgi:hypothetical protein